MRFHIAFGWLILAVYNAQLAPAAEKISETKLPDFAVAILTSQCIGCHGADKQEGGLRLDSRAAALKGGDSGPAFIPGDAESSLLIRAVRQTHESLAMPPKEKLKGAQISLLERWVGAGAIWPSDVLILFDEEQAFITSLTQGNSRARSEQQDAFSGKLSVAVTLQERFADQIADWAIPIRKDPRGREYRYLRFVWKKIGGGGGTMLEIAQQRQWPPAKASPPPGGRYVAGPNSSGLGAIVVSVDPPAQWSAVTVDLWKDMGEFELTGLSLMCLGEGEALFDQILLARSVSELDAYKTGRGRLAFKSGPSGARIGDAWSDPANPVFQTFGGERLDLWSLKRPIRAAIPQVQDKAWGRHPIDRFIWAKLEAAGIKPSAEADRRTLIRRLCFDLIGLPPTPAEVLAFLEDTSDKAYEKLVDRLLADPYYGERWARHWLDVVRYADTNGYERDEFRPNAYRYRDYVIRSLNADKPYDEFIREQLAGDEMLLGTPQTQAEADRLIATGFLRAGQFDSTASIFQEDARARDQLMADLTNTTCSAFLALTVSCANCHDHKYDPLLQADHFRLRAFFAAVRAQDNMAIDLAPVQQKIQEHNVTVETKIAKLAAQLAAVVDSARLAIVKQRTIDFPQEIQDLLTTPSNLRDDATREKLKPFEEKLKVSDADVDAALADEQKQTRDRLRREIKTLNGTKQTPATGLVMGDDGQNAQATHIFFQGDHTNPRDEVPPGFPSVFDPNPAKITPPHGNTTGRRSALADWIASAENPLTARVMVNRIWQHHFGVPLVATPNDFGYSGARPTHPELLDWLAVEFTESGWSMKHLHRLMLLSAAYRQRSAVDPQRHAIDPENHLLWRQNVQRLDAEAMRDAMLDVSGKLLPLHEGKPLWPTVPEDILRAQKGILEAKVGGDGGRMQGWYEDPEEQTDVRSVFLITKRALPLPFLQAFDLPDPSTSCARRDVSTVAPQALNLLNSAFAIRMAQAMADRVLAEVGDDRRAQVERAVWLTLSRPPTKSEREALEELMVRNRADNAEHENPQREALVDVCRVLLNVNAFVYLD